MVKWGKPNIALRGKSTREETLESLGHRLKARVVEELGKCVPERKKCRKVTNESGTAAKTASYAHGGYRRLFYLSSPYIDRTYIVNNHIGGNLYVSV